MDRKIIKDIKKTVLSDDRIDTIALVSADHGYRSVLVLSHSHGKSSIVLGGKHTSGKLKETCRQFILLDK